MTKIAGRFFGDELTKLWGMKNCKDIKIHIPLNGLVEITALFNATNEQGKDLIETMKKYNLVEVTKEAE